jgi:uncharacterized membrane protein YfhO
VVSLDVHAEHAGTVVLADAAYPGWQATVDGQPAEVLTANYLFRAVQVEAGRHSVVCRLRPRSLMYGAALGAAGLALCLAALAAAAAGARRRRRTSPL